MTRHRDPIEAAAADAIEQIEHRSRAVFDRILDDAVLQLLERRIQRVLAEHAHE